MEESVRRYGNVVSPPGERCRYSNIGYGILDYLIERLSGTSYSDFMRREVFLPLGMNHSSVDIGPGLEGFQAIRYSDNGLALPFYDFDHRGASAVFSSAHDLVRFAMCHLKQLRQDQKAILSDESIEAMQVPTASMGSPSPADPNLRTRSGYGTGWVIDDDELDYRVSHGGGMGGVATKLLLLPREGIAVAALANTGCQLPYKIEGDILSVLLPGYAARLAERQAKKTGEAANVPASEFQAVPELLGNWRGVVQTYKGTLPMELSFKPSGDIHARLKDQLWALLNDARLMDGRLSGKMLGNIGTEDANRRPYDLHLDLKLRGNVLNGSITAISLPTRLGNALSHWVEVKKDQ
jgi:CubicO group peptidase (beta-lactamase class C family)